MLFKDLDDPETCSLKPPVGIHRVDKYKCTKNFWKTVRLSLMKKSVAWKDVLTA